jgi:hypothetical protein
MSSPLALVPELATRLDIQLLEHWVKVALQVLL